jgi:hypothetical protein
MVRSLVDEALEKASRYEAEGNTAKAQQFLALAEKADKVYDKFEGRA